MPDVSLPYPLTPASVDPAILQPSPEFKKAAVKALAGILLFVVIYALLVAAALALAVLCAVGGIGLIALKPMFLTIMLGLGMTGLGIMVVVFLFKFLFKQHTVDRSGLVEIREKDQPRLFAFIRKLASETHTPFPKRIYLSPDVNAAVFYDSGFWSMFLPVKKNLLIGLGVVNSVNVSEFKAIIAHEFGHFSQRSMKVGSYVYNMNHIIFNLLYDNEGYQGVMEKWASISGYFAFFAGLTIRIVMGIQWVLQQVYAVVNKIYMGLSRQMEFHADTVAASVTGGNHLVTSLRRLEVAQITYDQVLAFYQENFNQGLKPENIYPQHREVMRQYSEYHGLPLSHDLPQVDAKSFSRFDKTRVVITDQWASHPSNDDREQHLCSLNIETSPQRDAAWLLFDNAEALQQQITAKVFEQVQYSQDVQLIDATAFRTQYRKSVERYQAPAIYRGYFDNRAISSINLDAVEGAMVDENATIKDLFTDEILTIPYDRNGLVSDLQSLSSIMKGEVRVKQFEFNGEKTEASQAIVLHEKLGRELEEVEKRLLESDEKIVAWFFRKAGDRKAALREKYCALIQAVSDADNDMKVFNGMHRRLLPLYNEMPHDQIQKCISSLKTQEVEFRERLGQLLADASNADFIPVQDRPVVEEYLSHKWVYFAADGYVQEELGRLQSCLSLFYQVITEKALNAKAEVLRFQSSFV